MYAFKHVGNPDEKEMYLNIHQNYTVDIKSAREARFKSTGYDNQCMKVMLCIATFNTYQNNKMLNLRERTVS
jgi:hypothetical protein